jgi:hypothetical protein
MAARSGFFLSFGPTGQGRLRVLQAEAARQLGGIDLLRL